VATERRRSHPALVLGLWAVLGAGCYAGLLQALVGSGLLDAPIAPDRQIGLIATATLAAIALRAAAPGPAATPGPTATRPADSARALTAAGASWSLLSVLDMHVTGFVPEHLVGPLADVALHGPGFLAVTAGAGALLAGDRWMSTLSPGGSS
jgi:hypothetical protein